MENTRIILGKKYVHPVDLVKKRTGGVITGKNNYFEIFFNPFNPLYAR